MGNGADSDGDVFKAAESNAEEYAQQERSQKLAFMQTIAQQYNIGDGLKALDKVSAFDRENAKRDKDLQVALGATDFAEYMAQEAPRRNRERESLATAAYNEAKVAQDQMNLQDIADEAQRFEMEDATRTLADYSTELSTDLERHNEFSAVVDTADDTSADTMELIGSNPDFSDDEKELMKASAQSDFALAKGAAGKMSTDAQKANQERARIALEKRRASVRDDLAYKAFVNRYGFLKSLGKDDVTAFAMAKQSTKKTVETYLKNLITKGNSQDVLSMLDGFEKDIKDSFVASRNEVGPDGKKINPLGKIDPRAGAYLTLTDIANLRKAAYQGLDDAINESKRKAQRTQDGLLTNKIAVNEKIDKHFANINLADGTVGMTNERRDAQYKEIWNEIKKLDDAGLDDAGALFLKLSNGTLARQKYSESTRRKLELEAARNKKAMTKAELQAQEARLKENIKRLIENLTAKEKVKLERKGEDGKPQVYEVEMSANEMIQMYIEIARMNDLCKGDEWTKIYKEHGNAERNLAIVNQVMNEMFEFPVEESSYGSKKKGEWGDRAEGSGTMLTFALADHAGVKCTNVYGEGMRVKTKQGNPLSFWGNEKPDWITGTVIAEMVAQGVKYLNDFAPADGQKAIEAIRQFWGESLKKARLEKDCTAMQNAMIRNLTQGLDYMRSGQVSGGMVGGKLRFAKGNVTRRQIHELAMLTDIGQNVKTAQKNYNTAAQNYDIMLEAAKDNAAEQQYINGISLETE